MTTTDTPRTDSCPQCGKEHNPWRSFPNRYSEILADLRAGYAGEIISQLEALDLGWSLDYIGRLREARIWKWPYVIGRYRSPNPAIREPLADMLMKAVKDSPLAEEWK